MILRCSGLELDTTCFSVTRDGEDVSVTPKVFDLLVYLIRHRDRLVTREELFDALWSGRVVSDNVLSNEIKQARAVLGDDGDQQKYIKTVRGRGYQFVGEVQEMGSAADPAGPQATNLEAGPITTAPTPLWRQPALVFVALLATALPTFFWLNAPDELTVAEPVDARSHTVAIMPFENRSNMSSDAFFVDGFHDDLITQVAQIRDLATISRASVTAYRDSNDSTRAIGAELGATIIIEGGVQRAAEQVRINVQMIDVATDQSIWAETYTRQLNAQNVFAIQSEIAYAVATNLQGVLSRREQKDIVNEPTDSLAALESFFLGRLSAGRQTSEDFGIAVTHFQNAVALDPNFAEAHAQLALALLEERVYNSMQLDENIALAEVAIQNALSLDPELSQAFEALALLEREKGDYISAEAAYEKALELNPGNADAIRMFAYFKTGWLGEHESALELLNTVKLLDPSNPITLTLLAQTLEQLERFDEALENLNAAIASAPDFAEAWRVLADLYSLKLYQHDEAIKAFRRFYSLDPDTPWIQLELATAYDDLGLADDALFFLERYLEVIPEGPGADIARVRIHLIRGDEERLRALLSGLDGDSSSRLRWIATFLNGFDLADGNPEKVIERMESQYPDLVEGHPEIAAIPDWFGLSVTYATALHATGRGAAAEPLTQAILELLPTLTRHRWAGVQTQDTWLYMAMGDKESALRSLREWRDMGGRVDLTKHRMLPATMFDIPEVRAMNDTILEELAEQRGNLARMEAAGELAPVPELPASE